MRQKIPQEVSVTSTICHMGLVHCTFDRHDLIRHLLRSFFLQGLTKEGRGEMIQFSDYGAAEELGVAEWPLFLNFRSSPQELHIVSTYALMLIPVSFFFSAHGPSHSKFGRICRKHSEICSDLHELFVKKKYANAVLAPFRLSLWLP